MSTPNFTPGTTTQNGLVAESDFNYEAPDNTPDYDLRGEENDFIKQFLAEEADKPLAPPEDEAPEDVEEVETPAPEAEVPPEEEEDDPKLARGVSRLVARELAAKERESAADRKIEELKVLQAEVAQYRGLKNTKELAEMADIDPIGMFKALGKDPEVMIKLALAQQLGDEAPEKLKEFARDAGTKREIAALRAQLAQEAQARAAQEYFNTISSGARQYVTTVGDNTPTLSKAAKADPDYVHGEIMNEIVSDSHTRAAQDPGGEPMSYEEAAKRVETRLAKLAKLFSVQNGTTSATKNVTKPKAPVSTKSAPRPLAPWQVQSSTDEDGIREALREYDRVEAERKARRT